MNLSNTLIRACIFFFSLYGDHRDLHVLTHSFPTRRSSDLRNLELPIAEMGLAIRAETRTGDTPQGKRRRQRRIPPHILLTTPESLALLLSRSEEHTSELQSLMRNSYAVSCLRKTTTNEHLVCRLLLSQHTTTI